jgi:hypothetical protein
MKKPLTLLAAACAAAVVAAPAMAAQPTDKVPSAQKQCRDERSAMGTDTFKATYGTNKNGANAFGKCVSQRNAATREARKAAHGDKGDVAKTVKAEVKADVNAAKTCKAERKADAGAFAEKYGAKRNAFGKCVSQTVREREGS